MVGLLWIVLTVILILWLIGFAMNIAGGLVHVLLVIALIVLIANLLSGRRSRL